MQIGFSGTDKEIEEIKAYYKAKGYRTGASFLRKIIYQYMTTYPVRSQECAFTGGLRSTPELKKLIRTIVKEEIKNEQMDK